MSAQADSVAVTGMNAVTAISGQLLSLFPEIHVTSADGSPVEVTLLVPATDGTLSVAGLPADLYATLIQRPDVSTSVVTFSGTASEVASALSQITLTSAAGLASAVTSTYQLILANDSYRSYLNGKVTITPAPAAATQVAPVSSAASTDIASTTTTETTAAAPYTQTGTSYVVASTAAQPATLDVGMTASTVTSGAASLDFTGGNSILDLTGSGSTTVHSLGGNTVNAGSASLMYVSGGDSTLHASTGSISIVGGNASDSNVVELAASGAGTVSITTSGPAATVLFGGTTALNYSGGNGTLVLNGAGMTGSAVIDSTGNNTVWAGAGDLDYKSGGASTPDLTQESLGIKSIELN